MCSLLLLWALGTLSLANTSPTPCLDDVTSREENAEFPEALDCFSKEQIQQLIDREQKELSNAMNKFTQSIYLHMAESNDSNFVFSPLSMHSALSMLYLGTTTNSTTENELQKAMGGITSKLGIKAGYKKIVGTYDNKDNFLYGNNFWVQDGIKINEAFRKTVVENLNSGIENIDFNAEDSVDRVNKWVANMTGNKIKKMVDSFSGNTALYLANALYFKEDWLVPFEDVDVRKELLTGEFETNKGKKKVNMIQQINSDATYGEIKLFSNHLVEVISLPYMSDLFEMQLIVPKKGQLNELEGKMRSSHDRDLTPAQKSYFNLFSNIKNETIDEFNQDISEVYLRLPTFQVRSDLDVVSSLKKLGAEKVFESGAELGEMGSGNLVVSKVSHTALLEVTKEGTEGAAATGAEIVLLSASFLERKDVVVDRPFIFVVQDKVNNIPVLVGRITDPTIKIP